MTCQKCETISYREDKFCRFCGNDLRTKAFSYCTKCKEYRSPSSLYCEECGSKLQKFFEDVD